MKKKIKMSVNINHLGLIAKYIPYLRNQSYGQILSNYYSNYPQPFIINDIDEFNSLYVDFDLAYYTQIHGLGDYTFLDIMNHYHLIGKYRQDLFNPYIKLVFYTPPIDNLTGGIDAIFNMANKINKLNYNKIKAYVYSYDHTKPKNALCNFYISPHQIDEKTIVVYPETIPNNPLNAKHIIRWVLLDLGLEMPKDHFRYWSPNDLVYHWEPNTSSKYIKNLTNIFYPEHLWNKDINLKENKNQTCVLYKKGRFIAKAFFDEIDTFHNDDSIDLDVIANDKPKIINCLSTSRYFYSYDPNTFFNIMAPLLGCITILHPPKNTTRQEYFANRIMAGLNGEGKFDAGIAYGNNPNEIERAKQTLPLAREQFKNMVNVFNQTPMNMLKEIYNYMEFNLPLTNTVKNIYYENSNTN